MRNAFEESPLAKVNCQGLDPSDYKKIGAKLKVCGAFWIASSYLMHRKSETLVDFFVFLIGIVTSGAI